MKITLAVTLTVVAVLIGLLMERLGAFKPVVITQEQRGPIRIVYKKHVGAYHKIVPVIEAVETWAKAHGESCRFSFGEYEDNPDRVIEDRLRSNGGCIVDRTWATGLPDDFFYREVSAQTYVTAQFSGAPSIGPMKVYPKVEEFIVKNKYVQVGSTFEIYEVLSSQDVSTTYLFPVNRRVSQ